MKADSRRANQRMQMRKTESMGNTLEKEDN
jgi:hypothetical protein